MRQYLKREPIKYFNCTKCHKKKMFLLEGGRCSDCYVPDEKLKVFVPTARRRSADYMEKVTYGGYEHRPLTAELVKKIAKLILDKYPSKSDFCRKNGISPQMLRKWETRRGGFESQDRMNPTIQRILKEHGAEA